VEGRHGLQPIQRLRDVYPEVSDLQRWDLRYHACSLRIARECDLILQDRLPALGLGADPDYLQSGALGRRPLTNIGGEKGELFAEGTFQFQR